MTPSISDLDSIKDHLGPLVFLDFSDKTPEDAHRELGISVKRQVHKILQAKLDGLGEEEIKIYIRQVRLCLAHLVERSHASTVNPDIRSGLNLYVNCLSHWAEGAGLGEFNFQNQSKFTVDNRPLSSMDLALLLQYDNGGCITGMVRQPDGSVVLWHTEEDVENQLGSHFDHLKIIVYQVMGINSPIQIHAFIYPELLPGAAFAWRSDGFIQASDALILKPTLTQNAGALASVASWLTLTLGPKVEMEEIIRSLSPFYDGCVINNTFGRNKNVIAKKCEFAAGQILSSSLGQIPQKYLLQANVFSQKDESALIALEDMEPGSRLHFEKRIERTEEMIRNNIKKMPSPGIETNLFFDILASQAGGEWAYANPDVKAYFLAWVNPDKIRIWLGPGPFLPGEQPMQITFDVFK